MANPRAEAAVNVLFNDVLLHIKVNVIFTQKQEYQRREKIHFMENRATQGSRQGELSSTCSPRCFLSVCLT